VVDKSEFNAAPDVLKELIPYLAIGWAPEETAGNQSLCGIYALSQGVRNLMDLDDLTTPLNFYFNALKNEIRGEAFKKFLREAVKRQLARDRPVVDSRGIDREMILAVRISRESDLEALVDKTMKEARFGHNNFYSVEELSHFVRYLNKKNKVTYRLGVISTQDRRTTTAYIVEGTDPLQELHYPVIWLHNNNDMHWESMGPKSSWEGLNIRKNWLLSENIKTLLNNGLYLVTTDTRGVEAEYTITARVKQWLYEVPPPRGLKAREDYIYVHTAKGPNADSWRVVGQATYDTIRNQEGFIPLDHVTMMIQYYISGRSGRLKCVEVTKEPTQPRPTTPEPKAANPITPISKLKDPPLPRTTYAGEPIRFSKGPSATGPMKTGPSATGPSATGPSATGPTKTAPTNTAPSGPGPTRPLRESQTTLPKDTVPGPSTTGTPRQRVILPNTPKTIQKPLARKTPTPPARHDQPTRNPSTAPRPRVPPGCRPRSITMPEFAAKRNQKDDWPKVRVLNMFLADIPDPDEHGERFGPFDLPYHQDQILLTLDETYEEDEPGPVRVRNQDQEEGWAHSANLRRVFNPFGLHNNNSQSQTSMDPNEAFREDMYPIDILRGKCNGNRISPHGTREDLVERLMALRQTRGVNLILYRTIRAAGVFAADEIVRVPGDPLASPEKQFYAFGLEPHKRGLVSGANLVREPRTWGARVQQHAHELTLPEDFRPIRPPKSVKDLIKPGSGLSLYGVDTPPEPAEEEVEKEAEKEAEKERLVSLETELWRPGSPVSAGPELVVNAVPERVTKGLFPARLSILRGFTPQGTKRPAEEVAGGDTVRSRLLGDTARRRLFFGR
jgi:hypothetical protein